MATAAFVLIAYLMGSLSFAVIVSSAFVLPDPRSYGSRSPGATNVLRMGKKVAALLTLIGDGGKGWLAVFLAARYAAGYGVDATGVATCAVAVFLGHLFPVFFGFQGGKGVFNAGGILLAIDPRPGLATCATWIVIAVLFRYSSLAAVVGAGFSPPFFFFLFPAQEKLPPPILLFALLLLRPNTNILKPFPRKG